MALLGRRKWLAIAVSAAAPVVIRILLLPLFPAPVGVNRGSDLGATVACKHAPTKKDNQAGAAATGTARLARLIIECMVAVGLAPFETQ